MATKTQGQVALEAYKAKAKFDAAWADLPIEVRQVWEEAAQRAVTAV